MQKIYHKHKVNDRHCFCSFHPSILEKKSNVSSNDKCDPERTLVQLQWESKKYKFSFGKSLMCAGHLLECLIALTNNPVFSHGASKQDLFHVFCIGEGTHFKHVKGLIQKLAGPGSSGCRALRVC